MDGQGDQPAYLGDLECLGGGVEGKMIKMIKVLNILMAGSLIILPTSMRSARKKILCPSGEHLGRCNLKKLDQCPSQTSSQAKQNAVKQGANHAVTSVATQPHME